MVGLVLPENKKNFTDFWLPGIFIFRKFIILLN